YRMKLIERSPYLERLISVVETPDIKVITGIRRSGKSVLLESFISRCRGLFPDANIIHINFNFTANEYLREYHSLLYHIETQYKDGVKNIVCIDEVQMCTGFENAINSLHATGKYAIYLTGSNAYLLSGDLATLFTGRVFEISVYPFSFSEFRKYWEIPDIDEAFERYLREGGMPGSYPYKDQDEKYAYLQNIVRTLLIRDILQNYRIKNTTVLERLCNYLIDNVSNQTSVRNIAASLSADGCKTNHITAGNYVHALCSAFAFYRVNRYDIQGKRYLSTQEKYYLADHAFRYALHGTKNLDHGRVLENIVAIELLRRGYEVYAGTLYEKEIDFVALKRNEKLYIQVADDITRPETFQRECEPLQKIRDSYPKMILARTKYDASDHEGIRILDIARWLAETGSGSR
ncbi:MAG TPA: ATP-binding protein, partial [Methanocorpusculum sp.]|nr:ATP-binding protein [Methanocorpusculum sp.]